jgi:hypothetical protein
MARNKYSPYPINRTTRIPVIGPWIGRVGFVNQIMATPCSPSPEVWVQAFFAGVPHMFWRAYKPTPLDAKYDTLKLRPGGSHGRKGFFANGSTKDLNFKPGTFGWAVFSAAEIAQKVGWYLLIADIISEQAVNWTSLAYEWSGCNQPNAGWADCRCTQLWNLSYAADTVSPLLWDTNSSNIFGTSPIGIYVPDGYDASCGGGITMGPDFLGRQPQCSFSIEVRDTMTGFTLFSSDSKQISETEHAAVGFYRAAHLNSFGRGYRMYIHKSAGYGQITSGFMSANGTGNILGLRPDP